MSRKIRLIKGASYTSKGVHATKKDPEIIVDEATAEKAVASGFFRYVDDPAETVVSDETPGEEAQDKDGPVLEEMTYTQLKELAAQMGIDTKGLKSKASLMAAIEKSTEEDPVVVSRTMLRLQES